jgi:hypothetical protein
MQRLIQWEKNNFSRKVFKSLKSQVIKNEVGSLPHTIHKINSTWTKKINVRTEPIKLLQKTLM